MNKSTRAYSYGLRPRHPIPFRESYNRLINSIFPRTIAPLKIPNDVINLDNASTQDFQLVVKYEPLPSSTTISVSKNFSISRALDSLGRDIVDYMEIWPVPADAYLTLSSQPQVQSLQRNRVVFEQEGSQ